jgi:hypothetical protein
MLIFIKNKSRILSLGYLGGQIKNARNYAECHVENFLNFADGKNVLFSCIQFYSGVKSCIFFLESQEV